MKVHKLAADDQCMVCMLDCNDVANSDGLIVTSLVTVGVLELYGTMN